MEEKRKSMEVREGTDIVNLNKNKKCLPKAQNAPLVDTSEKLADQQKVDPTTIRRAHTFAKNLDSLATTHGQEISNGYG